MSIKKASNCFSLVKIKSYSLNMALILDLGEGQDHNILSRPRKELLLDSRAVSFVRYIQTPQHCVSSFWKVYSGMSRLLVAMGMVFDSEATTPTITVLQNCYTHPIGHCPQGRYPQQVTKKKNKRETQKEEAVPRQNFTLSNLTSNQCTRKH